MPMYRVCSPESHHLYSIVGELGLVSCFLLDDRSSVIEVSDLGQEPRRYPTWYDVVDVVGFHGPLLLFYDEFTSSSCKSLWAVLRRPTLAISRILSDSKIENAQRVGLDQSIPNQNRRSSLNRFLVGITRA